MTRVGLGLQAAELDDVAPHESGPHICRYKPSSSWSSYWRKPGRTRSIGRPRGPDWLGPAARTGGAPTSRRRRPGSAKARTSNSLAIASTGILRCRARSVSDRMKWGVMLVRVARDLPPGYHRIMTRNCKSIRYGSTAYGNFLAPGRWCAPVVLCGGGCVGQLQVRLQMRTARLTAVLIVAAAVLSPALADAPAFTGEWQIDLRTSAERRAGIDCGAAGFKLAQFGDRITGSHWMVTPGCGRENEGGDETVVGVVRDGAALLTVTSARNGEVVRGRATREGPNLRWQVLEELKRGEPEGDSGLILHKGLLRKRRS